MAGTTDFTQGAIGKSIITFAIPIFLGSMIQQGYLIADSAIVGRMIGPEALAAVGVSTPVVMSVIVFMNGFATGVSILVSQLFGSKNNEKIRNLAFSTVSVFFSLCLLLSVLFILSAKAILLGVLNTPLTILQDAAIFLRIYIASLPFIFLYNVYAFMMRSLGNSRTPMVCLAVCSVANIMLDLLFIGPLNMGVMGAGLATAISQTTSGILLMTYARKQTPMINIFVKGVHFDGALFKQCMKYALPNAVQMMLLGTSNLFLQRLVNSFDTAVIAAQSLATRLDTLPSQASLSLSRAFSAFVGQNFGAMELDRISKGLKFCLILGCCVGISVTAVYCAVPEILAGMFIGSESADATNAADVVAKAATLISVTAFSYVFMFITNTIMGLLRGTGDVMFTSAGVFAIVVMRIVMAYALVWFTDIGFVAIALSMLFMWAVGAIGMALRYRLGGWKNARPSVLSDETLGV